MVGQDGMRTAHSRQRESEKRQYRASARRWGILSALTLPRPVSQRGFVLILARAFRASY